MKKTITQLPTPQPTVERIIETKLRSGLNEKVGGALIIFICLFLLANAVYLAISILTEHRISLSELGNFLSLSFLVSLALAALLLLTWTYVHVRTPLAQQGLQHQLLKWELARKMGGVVEDEEEGTIANLNDVAQAMIERYCARESPTRRAMVAANLCSQYEWNLVSRAMRPIGLKRNKDTFTFRPSPEAVDAAVRTFESLTWWKGDRFWAKRVDERGQVVGSVDITALVDR